jgi:predicted P-loop ATPase/GTPase
MRLLVAGADRVDAGKTTFTTGLVHELGAVGFKPRAGNDYWFHHDDYRRVVEQGRLYGGDARRLAAASEGAFDPEELNPVHRLWMPTPDATGVLGQADKQFVADRVTDPDGTDRYVVNGNVDVPESAREHLPLGDAPVVERLPEFNDLMARWHAPRLSAFADRIRAADRAVVESYGDVANPLGDVAVDAVAVVEPTRVRVYDGERYLRACEAAGGSARGGQLEEEVGQVVSLLDPVARTDLPALDSEERADPATVARAYDHSYDALLAAALE